jgi:threonine/homoserine/homoserine lactone efflux protein
MNELIPFLLSAIIISLSGVMAPGAMTAAIIAQGTHNRWAGALMSVGHGIVEIPLIFLLMLGLHLIFESKGFQISIGIAGGLFLLWMGAGMIRQITIPQTTLKKRFSQNPLTTGILLSATNPLFLLWWAAVGLKLAMDARALGMLALVLFVIVHWLCDVVWLSILSFGAFYTHKSAGLFRGHIQKGILACCGGALLVFGGKFIWDAVNLWPA